MTVSRLGYFNDFYTASASGQRGTAGQQWQLPGKYIAEGSLEETETEKKGLMEKQEKVKTGQTEVPRGTKLMQHLQGEDKKAPYSYLAKDGVIEYNGVTFICDEDKNRITLGDVSDSKNVINIPLEGGGSLVVNRDSIDSLSKAISMFSPEDVNRIMRALAADAKARQMENELEDEECAIGEKIAQAQNDNAKQAEGTQQTEESIVEENGDTTGEWKSRVYQSLFYEDNKKE